MIGLNYKFGIVTCLYMYKSSLPSTIRPCGIKNNDIFVLFRYFPISRPTKVV